MPSLKSPEKSPSRRSHSPAPAPPRPPAKAIDLNSSTRSTDPSTGHKFTRRAFLCDVVVERQAEETASLISALGQPLTAPHASGSSSSIQNESTAISDVKTDWTAARSEEMEKRVSALIDELVRTERSYLARIRALKLSYADPLRAFARNADSRIIPVYEAKTLFANIDDILVSTATFLLALEKMWESSEAASRIGDVCLLHFKTARTFEPYRPYLSKQDESQKMLQDCLRRFSGFANFIESTKYQTTGIGNIGLRELLMEPVQRIPRYTLLWQTMLKCMSPLSDQRPKLLEASELASRIARCEPDPNTIRATVMYCLEKNVDGFPADLFSSSRDFVDCIDVDDTPHELPSASPDSRLPGQPRPLSSASSTTPSLSSLNSASTNSHGPVSPPQHGSAANNPLHCTLFLFDDKLIIVKRQASAISGRAVTGLDNLQKLIKTGGGVAVMDKSVGRRDKLSFKGAVDVMDIIATDVGNGDFHLFLQRPPMDQGDRWSGRAFRAMTTVHPPFFTALDPVVLRNDKLRFVHNLWAAQATVRAKILPKEARMPPLVLRSDSETDLARFGETFGRAQSFWNVWDRRGYLCQGKRAKVVVHIDQDGISPELELATSGPIMIIRLQPMAGGLCRFALATTVDDDVERTIVDIGDVQERIIAAIHRYGIFKFRTSAASAPNTPSSTVHRLRPAMLNLDAISRNLFGSSSLSGRSQSSQTDVFGASIKQRGSRSARASISSRQSVDMRSISSDESKGQRGRRSASPDDIMSDVGHGKPRSPYKDPTMGQSELDLNERLSLARNNSKSMAALSPTPKRTASKMASRSAMDLQGTTDGIETAAAEAALREALRTGSPLPETRTPPLRIRNKTPSPTRSLVQASPTKAAGLHRAESTIESRLARMQKELLRDSKSTEFSTTPQTAHAPTEARTYTSPRKPAPFADVRSAPTTPVRTSSVRSPSLSQNGTAPLSPRPMGPRSPTIRSPGGGPGSTHTAMRILDGAGRPVSPDRPRTPLKAGASEGIAAPGVSIAPRPRVISNKRQHSEDNLSPRKRSPTHSPMDLRTLPKAEDVSSLPDQQTIPSPSPGLGLGRRRTSRQSSTSSRTPRKASTPKTMPRTWSASNISVNSTGSAEDEESDDVSTVMENMRRRMMENRATTQKLRAEVEALQRANARESLGKSSVSRLERTTTLPRSPQRRDIKRLVDMDVNGQEPTGRRGSIEHEALSRDETLRSLGTLLDKADGQLKSALSGRDRAASMLLELIRASAQKSAEIERLHSQVARAKDHQDLLRQQLADTQTEVDVMYEAFNTELDGMFSDAQLPETEAFQRLTQELKSTKISRNELAAENLRLKTELEEANLKRKHLAELATRGHLT